jgi:hypothetical protein
MTEQDNRKLSCIIEMVMLAERDGATIISISRELARRGYTAEETNAAGAYMAS